MSVSKEQTLHGVKVFLWILLVLAVLLAIWGVFSRVHGRNKVGEETAAEAIPVVQTAKPSPSPASNELVLPGNVTAFFEAPIYARTSGYLKSWYTDIGTPVKKGQILALLDTPEVDQQLRQAEADYATAQANETLAQSTAKRWGSLLATDSVSKQENDEKQADAQAKKALLASSRANLDRLKELEGFKRVIAPFDGVVTARQTDVGALINSGGGTGPAMFVVSDIKKLRVYVDVPQSYVPSIKMGAKAILTMPDYPNRTFPATVEASSQSVNVSTGTTQMQLALDNSKEELMPGGYASVRLSLARENAPLHIPSSALMFNQSGLRVATVTPDDKILFKTVTIARDLGRDIELASGLTAEDRVIVAPPDGIADGDQVRIAGAKGKPTNVSDRSNVKG
jgi:membrane fusion protein, multidrug efflux system